VCLPTAHSVLCPVLVEILGHRAAPFRPITSFESTDEFANQPRFVPGSNFGEAQDKKKAKRFLNGRLAELSVAVLNGPVVDRIRIGGLAGPFLRQNPKVTTLPFFPALTAEAPF
jgi:hypothetical protein